MRLVLLCALVTSGFAFAHAALTYPTPRSSDSAIKTGPCGQYAKLNNPTQLIAGQTLSVTWEETVIHPGHYRLAFSYGTDTDFNQNVLADNIPNPTGLQATNSYDVTLPNVNCDNCTLQLIMVMTEQNPPSYYYSCADIQLVGSDAGVVTDAGAGGGGGSTEDAGTEDAGTDQGAGGGGGGGVTKPTGTAQAEGGCSASGTAPMIVAAALLAIAIRRRSRPQP